MLHAEAEFLVKDQFPAGGIIIERADAGYTERMSSQELSARLCVETGGIGLGRGVDCRIGRNGGLARALGNGLLGLERFQRSVQLINHRLGPLDLDPVRLFAQRQQQCDAHPGQGRCSHFPPRLSAFQRNGGEFAPAADLGSRQADLMPQSRKDHARQTQAHQTKKQFLHSVPAFCRNPKLRSGLPPQALLSSFLLGCAGDLGPRAQRQRSAI